jgi:predicted DNA-binding transcriptional regulator AlpA
MHEAPRGASKCLHSAEQGPIEVTDLEAALAKLAARPRLTIGKKELAAAFSVSTRTIERWNKAGQIPAGTRVGPRVLRWSPEEITSWFRAREGNQRT